MMTKSSPIHAESFTMIVIEVSRKSCSQTNKYTRPKQYMAAVPVPRDAELIYTTYEKLKILSSVSYVLQSTEIYVVLFRR